MVRIVRASCGCPCSNLHKAEKDWRFSRAGHSRGLSLGHCTAICCGPETNRMVRHSVIEFERWGSRRSSLPRDHPGRIPTPSVSSFDPPRLSGSRYHPQNHQPQFELLSISPRQNASLLNKDCPRPVAQLPPQAILLPPGSAVCTFAGRRAAASRGRQMVTSSQRGDLHAPT